ncbi:MAG: hypothetical protein AAB857_01510 [Patescibacteria group bacterium]
MTNQQIIDKINQWQNSGFVHPLTCGNDSQHQDLIPKELDGKVVLACSDCNYIQNWIPEEVLSNYVERMKEIMLKTIAD